MGEKGIARSHDKYIEEINNIDSNILVLGRYTNQSEPILHYCKIHDFEFKRTPRSILNKAINTKHKKICPDRPIIDAKLQEEMKNYIQMMNNCNEPPKANEFSEEDSGKKIKDEFNNQNQITFSSVNVNELFDDCNMGNNVYDYDDINYDISMGSVNTRKKEDSTDYGIFKKGDDK